MESTSNIISPEERNEALLNGMVSPGIIKLGDLTLRPLTLGSMLQLQALGNPLGALDMTIFESGDPSSFYLISEFVWLHAADTLEIEGCMPGAEEEANRKTYVMRVANMISFTELPSLMKNMFGGLKSAQMSMVSPQADGDDDPKGHGPVRGPLS